MAQFTFRPRFARRFPDPVFEASHNIVRHVLFCPVKSVPLEIPLDPNARIPNINRQVYREIERSLLNEDVEVGMFHLKHKGITIVARAVEKKEEALYLVTLDEGEGILDGGHTYDLIQKHIKADDLPDNQYVKFEILTQIPKDWIADIAGGLNTSVQVEQMSLDSLAGKFDWIKETLKGEPYYKSIAWRENEQGEYDARDLVSIMTCFNIDLFPNDKDDHPVMAYSRKSSALQAFENRPETYGRLRPILKDILTLHDIIRGEACTLHNTAGGHARALAFVEAKKHGKYEFQFAAGSKPSENRLMIAGSYPILAAFRWMVEDDPETEYVRWKGGFPRVKALWKETAVELMKLTTHSNTELGRNPNVLGKSRSLWASLHTTVAKSDLMTMVSKS